MERIKLRENIRNEVIEKMDLSSEVDDTNVMNLIDIVLLEYSEKIYLSISDKLLLKKEVYNSIRGLDVLSNLLEDEEITEIMVNGFKDVFIEKHGQIYKSKEQFSTKEKLSDVIQKIVANANKIVNETSPIVDARLADGSRVNVVLSPIAIDGSAITIRKFPKDRITMEKLIELGSVSKEVAYKLKILVECGYNIFISGGTGSGKTTFLNALSNYIPSEERVITIEDSAELSLQNISNLVRLEVRNANVEGKNAITMRDLIKSALRMRPKRIRG